MHFEDLVNKLNFSIIVTDADFNLRFLNECGKNELNIPGTSWTSKKLDQVLMIRLEDKEKLKQALEDQLHVKLPVFIKSKKNKIEMMEKNMMAQPVELKDATMGYLLEISDVPTSTFGIQTIQSLGQVTGSLAHALSNPLAVIQINCDTLEIECNKNQKLTSENVKTKVGKIGNALERVSSENQKLKDLSRKLSSADEATISEILPTLEADQNH